MFKSFIGLVIHFLLKHVQTQIDITATLRELQKI